MRKRLASTALEIGIADVRNIIIDYLLTNRKHIDVLHHIWRNVNYDDTFLYSNIIICHQSKREKLSFWIIYKTMCIYSFNIRSFIDLIDGIAHIYKEQFDKNYERSDQFRASVLEYLDRYSEQKMNARGRYIPDQDDGDR